MTISRINIDFTVFSHINRSESSGHSNEDTVMKLRTELERALNNNKGKRNQVKMLQDQLKIAKEECERQKEQAEEAEFKTKDLQVLFSYNYRPVTP